MIRTGLRQFAWYGGEKVVEPKKRMVEGRYGWAIHRFPIKGGKTASETVIREWHERIAANVTRDNQILRLLAGRG